MPRPGALVWPLGLLLLLASCGLRPGAALEPAPEARRVGDDMAVAHVEGVFIQIEVEAWPGDRDVLHQVSPVLLLLRNDSGRDLRIQYRDFVIVGPDTVYYAALPPHDIETREPEELSAALFPLFHAQRFALDQPYDDLFPNLQTNRYRLGYSAAYHQRHFRSWPAPLPTREMQEQGLPEGVLLPGGELEGFLYFEKIPHRGDRFVFRFDIVDAQTDERLTTAVIPLRRR